MFALKCYTVGSQPVNRNVFYMIFHQVISIVLGIEAGTAFVEC